MLYKHDESHTFTISVKLGLNWFIDIPGENDYVNKGNVKRSVPSRLNIRPCDLDL